MKSIFICLIKLYQKTLSLIIGGNCRFYPTCSSYSLEAIEKYGAMKGSWLMIKRIIRCHPLNPGGFDPVPELQQQLYSGICDHNDHQQH